MIGRDHDSATTAFKAIELNVTKAIAEIEKRHESVLREQTEPEPELEPRRRVTVEAAAVEFLAWSGMEHRDPLNTYRRQSVSLASVRPHFFKSVYLDAIRTGDLESFKMWQRENAIKEVTIRHDLHAASQLFQFGRSMNG